MGEDLWGHCWFDTDKWSGWTSYGNWADEAAVVVFDEGPGTAGFAADVLLVRRCSTQPAFGFIELAVLRVLRSHDFGAQDAGFEPERGVVRLPTYLRLMVPSPGRYVIGFPAINEAIFIEVAVRAVRMDWGDGSRPLVVEPSRFHRMTGYPGGEVGHGYRFPGTYSTEIGLDWAARWRHSSELVWRPVVIGVVAEGRLYAVDEIVARLVR